MPGGWNCCCGSTDCSIASDNFDRATIGSGWSVSSGTWSIVSNKLHTASTSAYIKFLTVHPDSVAGHYVNVDITFSTRGDKAQIILSDTLHAELEWSAECASYPAEYGDIDKGCATLRIFEGSTLLDELRDIVITDSTINVSAGYIKADGKVWVLIDGYCLVAETTTPSTYYVGLGTGDTNAGNIDFDNFEFMRANSISYPDCNSPCVEDSLYLPCVIVDAFCVPEKTGLASTDIACDWSIISGTWDGEKYLSSSTYYSKITTTSSNALIECNTEQSDSHADDFGLMWSYFRALGAEGDVLKVYLDYNSTSSNHLAEITFGNSTDGTGGNVTLYKNGTEIYNVDGALKAGVFHKFDVCLRRDLDGSGTWDIFLVEIDDVFDTLRHHIIDEALAATTKNGNKKWAFGTGTVTGKIEILGSPLRHTGRLSDSTQCSNCGALKECDNCPGDDGLLNGISFDITGFGNVYSGVCNCVPWDGTYNAPQFYSCSAGLTTSTLCSSGGEDYYLVFNAQITAGTGTDWILTLIVELRSVNQYTGSISYYGSIIYDKTFTIGTLCRDFANETLNFNRYGGTGLSPTECSNWNGLTIKATAY